MSASPARTPTPDFAAVRTADRHRLTQAWRRARTPADYEAAAAQVAESAALVTVRHQARPAITLAPGLPVTDRADDISAAIKAHQVVVVTGDTGSGKTTQLPKILLQAGYGARGLIGHTQPRRLAARSVAQRIAQECGVALGGLIGFKTRFDDQLSADTQVKLMTDGIVLAETARDRYLNQYEAIIIDEAHERSLNIDFLLGYLKRLLPQRPDLKLIITSATIDPERLAKFFDDAPIVAVEGRTYPVELRYAPPDDADDLPESVFRAAHDLWREAPGDILVFLPGERDIRDCERHLSKAFARTKFSQADILPLYSRLTRGAQDKIFKPSRGRRIVLATNVAETSLTVPGIRYVIDPGLARISRYSTAAKVQRLPIEPVSKASCKQRMGRCGRVAEGVCVRLFSQEDFDARPDFTAPEIQRTNLASVLLTMADLKLGAVEDFPFIDPPQKRFVRDGVRQLTQLQALDTDGRGREQITKLGRKLARLPLDPTIGRVLLAADSQTLPALRVLAAALTIQDPRDRPAEARQKADEAHKTFTHDKSDFISLLRLWDAFHAQKADGGSSALKRWCRDHFVNFMRMREWQDLARQLKQLTRELKLPGADAKAPAALADAPYAAIHQALLTGLLDNIGLHDERGDYLGARGRKFRIFPGSAQAPSRSRKAPAWIVAAELIDTSQLFAHTVAAIEPQWIEQAAGHLVTREHYDPHWSAKRGKVLARERVKLFGLPLSDNRTVDFGPIEHETARALFIRDGLIPGALVGRSGKPPAFLAHNQAIIGTITEREARFRRRDLLVDVETQARFYDEALPGNLRDRTGLQQWLKNNDDAPLRLTEEQLLRHAGLSLPEHDYPDTLLIGQTPLALEYAFDTASDRDGVTLRVPLPMLGQISAARAQWLVPGLLEELICEYLRALPKALRRQVVPVPDYARAIAESLNFAQGRLPDQIRTVALRIAGLEIPETVWDDFTPSDHLRMRYAVIDDNGKPVTSGRDLDALRRELGSRARQAVAAASAVQDARWDQKELTAWPDAPLPEKVTLDHGGVSLDTVPALIDRGTGVDLTLIEQPARAAAAHRMGVARLLLLGAREQQKYLRRTLPNFAALAALKLPAAPDTALLAPRYAAAVDQTDAPTLLADLMLSIALAQIDAAGGPPRDAQAFEALAADYRRALVADGQARWDATAPALKQWIAVNKALGKNIPLGWVKAVDDIRQQLAHLVFAGCLGAGAQPDDLLRYLRAVEARIDKLRQNATTQDAERMRAVLPHWQAYLKLAAKVTDGAAPAELVSLRWMVEEFRVQQFAQPLGTAMKVSAKRLAEAEQAARSALRQ